MPALRSAPMCCPSMWRSRSKRFSRFAFNLAGGRDMDGESTSYTLKVVSRLGAIGAEAWDACAGPDNPFVSYAFLSALEDSGSANARAGWKPQHLTLVEGSGRIVACAPLYLKSHSQGEYVFDHGWADAYERAGGRYYPKLISAAPFSPVTGPRLMVRSDIDRAEGRGMLLAAAIAVCDRMGVTTLGVNFPTTDEWRALGEAGLLLRQNQQYHWMNAGYGSFDDFLAALSSGRRKTIRRERREA